MVVLAASVCTKGGKAVISRQFREMSATRIESLLAAFPKLIPTNTQHTSVETPEVRYVYQPLEDLYIVLITNKASNIIQDIDTLQLFARVVSDISRSADEREISKNAFELLWGFDEIITQGYREQVNLQQVRTNLEMDSHEEKISIIIAKNKEAEAKEELKRRAKQLEMQRREQQRRAATGGGGSYLGGGPTGYSAVPRYEAPEPTPSRITTTSSTTTPAARPPAFKGSGMKLGSKKTKQAELLDQLGGEVLAASESSSLLQPAQQSRQSESPTPKKVTSDRGSVPEVTPASVHVATKETLSLSLPRDGGVQAFELKGDMNLTISDAAFSHIKLTLVDSSPDFPGKDLQFKHHPHTLKFPNTGSRVVALKDTKRAFPLNQSIGVLKWRYSGNDESLVPLSLTVWPSPSNDGTVEVSLEYELTNENLTLYDVVISIPLPTGSYPTVTTDDHPGSWSLNPSTHSLAWTIPTVEPNDDSTKSGSFAFTVGGDDVAAFFPVDVKFAAIGSLAGIAVKTVELVGDQTGEVEEENVSVDALMVIEEYEIVDG